MSEIEPIPQYSEVSKIEFEDDLTEGEQVAIVCMYVLAERITHMSPEEREPLAADIEDIAACETLEEAMAAMAMLEDAVDGDIDLLFEALVTAQLIEGVEAGGDQQRQRSVTLGRNLLQLPLS